MSSASAITATKISETLENYAVSDVDHGDQTFLNASIEKKTDRYEVYSEKDFWLAAIANPEDWIDQVVTIPVGAVLSEWVARVPGLFYKKGSAVLRKIRKVDIEYQKDGFTHLTPMGKSRVVIGGIGTLKFPPDKEGFRMVSLTMSANASSGIPALVHPEVWKHHKLKTATVLDYVSATWRSMPSEWSTKFASTRDIPKACLFIDHPDAIKTRHNESPLIIHPFSIMKYVQDGTENYDFVFANIHTQHKDSRKNVGDFLGEYKYFEGRYGEYLIEPDINNPLIGQGDIVCQSPLELRQKMSGSKAYLELLLHRIQDVTFNDRTINEIKKVMDHHLTAVKTLKRFGTNLRLPPTTWYLDSAPLATNNAQLLDRCIQMRLVPNLIDEILENYPNAFN